MEAASAGATTAAHPPGSCNARLSKDARSASVAAVSTPTASAHASPVSSSSSSDEPPLSRASGGLAAVPLKVSFTGGNHSW
eukprot:5060138-Prymnesium_polylepis.1